MTISRLSSLACAAALCSLTVGACSDSEQAAPEPTASSSTASTSTAPSSTTVDEQVEPVIDPGDGGEYSPNLNPSEFTGPIDNPYLPMPIGSTWRYEGESEGLIEVIDVTVTDERRDIMGISAYVVRDTVTVDGELREDTYDWFAQDDAGNVWYLGEDVRDYENGKVVSTAGSWEAGVDGALPGIVMPADPTEGEVFRQEFFAGEAEDMMQITATGLEQTVVAGRFDDVVTTKDWSPLEPEVIEEKAYARGTGKIREEKVAGGAGFAELVKFDLGSS